MASPLASSVPTQPEPLTPNAAGLFVQPWSRCARESCAHARSRIQTGLTRNPSDSHVDMNSQIARSVGSIMAPPYDLGLNQTAYNIRWDELARLCSPHALSTGSRPMPADAVCPIEGQGGRMRRSSRNSPSDAGAKKGAVPRMGRHLFCVDSPAIPSEVRVAD